MIGKPQNKIRCQPDFCSTKLDLRISWFSGQSAWWSRRRFTNIRPAGGRFPPCSGERWTLSAGKVHSVFFFLFLNLFFQYKWTLIWCEVTFVMENSYTHSIYTPLLFPYKQNKKTKPPKNKKITARLTVHHIKALGCILIYPMHAAVCNRISE